MNNIIKISKNLSTLSNKQLSSELARRGQFNSGTREGMYKRLKNTIVADHQRVEWAKRWLTPVHNYYASRFTTYFF